MQFGAVNATSYTVDPTGTVITATSPAGTGVGLVDITVTTPQGTSPHIGADTFQYVAATTGSPSVTGLDTTQGPAAGGTAVTIHGANFTGATAVQFGAVNATSYTVDPTGTVITAVSPAGTAGTTVDITVTRRKVRRPKSWRTRSCSCDLNSIFATRFTLVFVEDNSYPNSVYNNHHQYRFEVHSDTSTSTLLAALNDRAFARGA